MPNQSTEIQWKMSVEQVYRTTHLNMVRTSTIIARRLFSFATVGSGLPTKVNLELSVISVTMHNGHEIIPFFNKIGTAANYGYSGEFPCPPLPPPSPPLPLEKLFPTIKFYTFSNFIKAPPTPLLPSICCLKVCHLDSFLFYFNFSTSSD